MTTAPTPAPPAPELRLPARDPAVEFARLFTLLIASLCVAVVREVCNNPLLIDQVGPFWRFLDRLISLVIRLIKSPAAGELPHTSAARQAPVRPARPAMSGRSTSSSAAPAAGAPTIPLAPSPLPPVLSPRPLASPASSTGNPNSAPVTFPRSAAAPFRTPHDSKPAYFLSPCHAQFITISKQNHHPSLPPDRKTPPAPPTPRGRPRVASHRRCRHKPQNPFHHPRCASPVQRALRNQR